MNCSWCQSKIFDSDRVCPMCGAPNIQIKNEIDTFGKLMMHIESDTYVGGCRENKLLFTYYHVPQIKKILNK